MGLGDTEKRYTPIKINFEHDILSVHCGYYNTMINTTDGVYGVGHNKNDN